MADDSEYGTESWRITHPRRVPYFDPVDSQHLQAVLDFVVRSVGISFPDNYVVIKTNSRNTYHQGEADQSFHKQHCEMFVPPECMDSEGAAQYPDGYRMGEYRSGNVCDLLVRERGKTYFASIFFSLDERKVRFRLYRLLSQLTEPLKSCENLKSLLDAGSTKLDEGVIDYGHDLNETGTRVIQWLQRQVSADRA